MIIQKQKRKKKETKQNIALFLYQKLYIVKICICTLRINLPLSLFLRHIRNKSINVGICSHIFIKCVYHFLSAKIYIIINLSVKKKEYHHTLTYYNLVLYIYYYIYIYIIIRTYEDSLRNCINISSYIHFFCFCFSYLLNKRKM